MSEKEKRSEVMTDASLVEYLAAHAQTNTGIKAFFKSNLFAALLVFFLGQLMIVGGAVVAMYWRTSALVEWKAKTDAKIEHMDSTGTVESHTKIENLSFRLGEMSARLTKIEANTEHLDVLEAETKQLKIDIDTLKREKKGTQ